VTEALKPTGQTVNMDTVSQRTQIARSTIIDTLALAA